VNVPWIFRLPEGTSTASALHVLGEAVGKSGTDPLKLRDTLASGESLSGIAFLSTGELSGH
jgi:hypothetical protein